MTKYVITNDDDDNVALGKWTDLLHISDSDTDELSSSQSHCLISHELLDHNVISLPCNHSFNFLPLYHELLRQNRRDPSLHCPYCRTVHVDTVLPHVKLNRSMVYRQGINQPVEFCLPFHSCEYIFSSGKQKGKCCESTAYITKNGKYCSTHHKTVQLQKEKQITKQNKEKEKEEMKSLKQKEKEEMKSLKQKEKEQMKSLKQKEKEQKKSIKQKEKEQKKSIKQKEKEQKKSLKQNLNKVTI
jgi:hypothetical protein